MIYSKMTPEMQAVYEHRIDNCVRVAENCDKDSWAYKYWMQVAAKLTRDLAASTNGSY